MTEKSPEDGARRGKLLVLGLVITGTLLAVFTALYIRWTWGR